MLFSVIIPTFNRCDLLRQALASVQEQSFKDFEVIVVDDGSTDETLEMLKAEYPQVRVLTQANAGPGAARNLGASHALGDYLVFLDSDDLWFPWTLATYERQIIQNDLPAVLSAKFMEFGQKSELAEITEAPMQHLAFSDYLASSEGVHYVGSGTAVLLRSEFFKVGGFCSHQINGEDHDLSLRMGTARGFVPLLAPFTLAWRRHIGGVTQNLRRSLAGSRYMISQEIHGNYPGGDSRKKERIAIITRHVRPVAVAAARDGLWHEAWDLYRTTWYWHIVLRRWRFLMVLPFVMLFYRIISTPKTA